MHTSSPIPLLLTPLALRKKTISTAPPPLIVARYARIKPLYASVPLRSTSAAAQHIRRSKKTKLRLVNNFKTFELLSAFWREGLRNF
jgi:hypothetical protein